MKGMAVGGQGMSSPSNLNFRIVNCDKRVHGTGVSPGFFSSRGFS